MKKYLFLGLSILSVFFISDRVEALSFTLNNEEVEVTKENYIYYIYQNYTEYFENYDYFVATNDLDYNKYYNVFFSNCKFVYDSSYNYYSASKCNVYRINFNSSLSTVSLSDRGSYNYLVMGSPEYILWTNYDILKRSDSSLIFAANMTKEDLAQGGKIPTYKITYYLNNEIYKEIEVEKGSNHQLENYSYNSDLYNFTGWSIENDLDISNITSDIVIRGTLEQKAITPVYIKNFDDFPITKTEFYSLLVLLGTLIMIIFLKWCFPFKGGSDLR